MATEGRRCVLCPRSVLRQRRHILDEHLPERQPRHAEYIQQNALTEVAFNNIQATCHRCWQVVQNAVRQQEPEMPLRQDVQPESLQEPQGPQEPGIPPQAEDLQQVVIPDYMRAPNVAYRCIFNGCPNAERLRIPVTIKVHILCEHRLYIPESARVCQEHLMGNDNWNFLIDNCNVTRNFSVRQITDMTNMLVRTITQGQRFDFELEAALTDNDLYFWTGLNLQQFNRILEETPSLAQRSNRPRTVLGIYMTKLRTGESNERLSTLFNISRRTLERKLAIARECLMNDFVNRHLGIGHISRENILQRNLLLPKGLFGNEENTKAIVIADGTYMYIEKSSNFLFQRRTYSLHKFQNLLKPFLMVCSDGYIIEVYGPYAATDSDASIMNNILNDEENPFHWMFHRNDVFILDRGFRDSVENLQALGYEAHIPPTKDRFETQLTTVKANKSRLITLCRWVVEAVNGKFKNRFKLLRQDYFNRALPHLFVDFKIAAALINAFYKIAVDNEHANEILRIANERLHTPNLLNDYVQLRNLNRQRAAFITLEANQLEDFPRLTINEIFMISLGSYQIELAKSYCSEHLRNGLYTIEVCRENELNNLAACNIHHQNVWLLRGRIQSRHVRARTYYVYILVNRNEMGRDAIAQYYCSCLTGRRTVGSCAHTISIIWYLGLGRHIQFNPPAGYLDDIIIDID